MSNKLSLSHLMVGNNIEYIQYHFYEFIFDNIRLN